jgi:hypothetical protein
MTMLHDLLGSTVYATQERMSTRCVIKPAAYSISEGVDFYEGIYEQGKGQRVRWKETHGTYSLRASFTSISRICPTMSVVEVVSYRAQQSELIEVKSVLDGLGFTVTLVKWIYTGRFDFEYCFLIALNLSRKSSDSTGDQLK